MMMGVFDEAQPVERISPINANENTTFLVVFFIFLYSMARLAKNIN